MRARSYVLGLGFVTVVGFGCSATGTTGGMGGMGGSGNGGGTGGTGLIGVGGGGGTGGIGPACAKFTAEAKQQSAAIMFVVDGSASMSVNNKWAALQIATVAAIDKDGFDDTKLGLMRFPHSFVNPPQCLCDGVCLQLMLPPGCVSGAQCAQLLGQPGVACGVPGLPQVAIADAGTQKSNEGGVRKSIYDYLANAANVPVTDASDASPIYDAMVGGYANLAAQDVDRRILILITDGGFSCTSLSNRMTSLPADGFGCKDWEDPDVVNTLISDNYNDPAKPIFTFIVGVPGSDSNGEGTAQGETYDTAPYKMRRALSTYAFSGAPDLIPAGCDHAVDVSTSASDPNPPCHFDLSQGNLDADALGQTIADIRGKALGCIYDIPDPPPGETVDLGLVNVVLTIEGVETTLPKRVSPMDDCAADGCWDFNGMTQIELLGKACADVSGAANAKVDILVGCATITK